MSQPLPEQSTFIAVGAWNPAIIQPVWLKKHFPTRTPPEIKLQFVTGGIFSFRLDFGDFFLEPVIGRLVFIPKQLDEKTLEKIADLSNGIIEKLEHTPITAAGCNFVFKLETNEHIDVEQMEPDDKIKSLYPNMRAGNTFVSKSMVHTFSFEDYQINFKYDLNSKSRILFINYHYPQPSADSMKKAANSLVQHYKDASEMVKNLIKTKKE
jgi:hypothetical protein